MLINGDTRQLMDSMALQDGKFAFKKLDSIAEPYMAVVRFINPNDSMDVMDMPVAIENGEVSITIEEYIKTKGTPINTYIQKFLDGMQALHDAMQMDRDADAKDVAEAFSSFYKEQIVTNSHNCLGKYIWKQYGMHLSAEDKEEAKTAITKN